MNVMSPLKKQPVPSISGHCPPSPLSAGPCGNGVYVNRLVLPAGRLNTPTVPPVGCGTDTGVVVVVVPEAIMAPVVDVAAGAMVAALRFGVAVLLLAPCSD